MSSDKDEFDREAKARRSQAKPAGAASFLLRQQEEQRHAPVVRPIDPNEAPAAKRSRAGSKAPVVQVPRPSFPTAASEHGLERRRDTALTALRAQAENRSSKVVTVSSHAVDLASLSSRLSAPSLSFDWQQPDFEDDDCVAKAGESPGPSSAAAGSLLTVDLPLQERTSGPSGPCSAGTVRSLFRQELQQRISSAQVKSLLSSMPAVADAGA
ncbi:unnamed protein product [Polarella glacialis]|uniref:Uncharacterized protein n=1 Tax=Polarella glacialis TaxID=89957 RepID=A0A813DPR1_POLGL|nr:unnamed protein product [Polarella glacialis]